LAARSRPKRTQSKFHSIIVASSKQFVIIFSNPLTGDHGFLQFPDIQTVMEISNVSQAGDIQGQQEVNWSPCDQ